MIGRERKRERERERVSEREREREREKVLKEEEDAMKILSECARIRVM